MSGWMAGFKERFSEVELMSRNDRYSFLLKRLEQHHQDTYWHSLRVASLCSVLFDALGIDPKKKELFINSALFHDIGKLMIDNRILNKEEKLSELEWKAILRHCDDGIRIMENLSIDKEIIDYDVIRYHHENLDGTGYAQLKDGQLTMRVRIIRVADSFDAMTAPRAYRNALSVHKSFEELYRWSGIHYDPMVVETLRSLLNEAEKNGYMKEKGNIET